MLGAAHGCLENVLPNSFIPELGTPRPRHWKLVVRQPELILEWKVRVLAADIYHSYVIKHIVAYIFTALNLKVLLLLN